MAEVRWAKIRGYNWVVKMAGGGLTGKGGRELAAKRFDERMGDYIGRQE